MKYLIDGFKPIQIMNAILEGKTVHIKEKENIKEKLDPELADKFHFLTATEIEMMKSNNKDMYNTINIIEVI